MRLNVFHVALIGTFALATPTQAADLNGYTAQYECRAGGQHCNVDVAALGTRACDQVVSTSTPWSSINWANATICIEAGDHTSKGTLTIPSSASGSAGSYKVLRYYRSGDNDDDPWKQGSNQARLRQLKVQGRYWLIHRLTFPQGAGASPRMESGAASSHHIYNRVLVEGTGVSSTETVYGYSQACSSSGYSNLTVQNSVFRNNGGQTNREGIALDMQCGTDLRAINNEIYDWCSHGIQTGHNASTKPTLLGLVIENNDMYVTPTMHLSSGYGKTEGMIDFKAKGTSTSPIKVIHNRFWGARRTNTAYCGNGGSGAALTLNGDADYNLIENNIVTDSVKLVAQSNENGNNNSVIGNLGYNFVNFHNGSSSVAIETGPQVSSETHLNTIIAATQYSLSWGWGDNDYRCNVFIASGPIHSGTPGSGTVADYNAFYGTPAFHANGGNNNIEESLRQRANSTRYEAGDVIRIGQPDQCRTENDVSCYLYKVVAAGVSAPSTPSYCTSANCTTNDGSMTVTAIRGPYTHYRRLRTAPERYAIPYARPYAVAGGTNTNPGEAYACPADFALRRGVGVNDDSF